jgi:hypothetical protein
MYLIDFLVVLAAAGISLVTAEIPQFNLNPKAVITRVRITSFWTCPTPANAF